MKKKHLKVIRELQSKVPKELMESLVKREKLAPTVDFVMDKALEDNSVSEDTKGRIRTLREAGKLGREVDVVDRETEKKLSEWWDGEIEKAQKKGLLPKKADMNDPLIKKALQAARRSKKNEKVEKGNN